MIDTWFYSRHYAEQGLWVHWWTNEPLVTRLVLQYEPRNEPWPVTRLVTRLAGPPVYGARGGATVIIYIPTRQRRQEDGFRVGLNFLLSKSWNKGGRVG